METSGRMPAVHGPSEKRTASYQRLPSLTNRVSPSCPLRLHPAQRILSSLVSPPALYITVVVKQGPQEST